MSAAPSIILIAAMLHSSFATAAGTPIESLARDEVSTLLCPSELVDVVSDSKLEPPCEDNHFGGCVHRDCPELFYKAARSQSQADRDAWENLCGSPKCPILNVTNQQRAAWLAHQMSRASECALPPPSLETLLLPGESTREDLDCWKDHSRFVSLARVNARARCGVNSAGMQVCPSAPCPISPQVTQELLSIKRVWCEYDEPDGLHVYECKGSAKKKKMGAICPMQHVDATSSQSADCQLIARPAQLKHLLKQDATLVHMGPLWDDGAGESRSTVLPGVPLLSFPQITTTRRTRWSECTGDEPVCEALSTNNTGWWQLARSLSAPEKHFAIHAKAKSAPPTVTPLERWQASDFQQLSNCSGDLPLRHHCDWSNLHLELLAADPQWQPITILVPVRASSEATTSVRCFANGEQDACIEHTTYSPARTAAVGPRPTTRSWPPMHDGWQVAGRAPRDRARTLLAQLLASQPGRYWRLVATRAASNGQLIAVVHDGENAFMRIEETADGRITPTSLIPVLSQALSELVSNDAATAKVRANFALDALLAYPKRVITTRLVQRDSKYAICWIEGDDAVDCVRSDEQAPWHALGETSVSALLNPELRRDVITRVMSQPAAAGEGATAPSLAFFERLLETTDERFSIVDAFGQGAEALALYSIGGATTSTATNYCTWEGRFVGQSAGLPLMIRLPARPENACSGALAVAYRKARENAAAGVLANRLLTAQQMSANQVWLLLVPPNSRQGAEPLVVIQNGAATGERLSASRLVKSCGWTSSGDLLARLNQGLPSKPLEVPLGTASEELAFMERVSLRTHGVNQSAEVLGDCGDAH
jgi:hypothetical protein